MCPAIRRGMLLATISGSFFNDLHHWCLSDACTMLALQFLSAISLRRETLNESCIKSSSP